MRPPLPGFFKEHLKIERLTALGRFQPLPNALRLRGCERAPGLCQPAFEEQRLRLGLRERVQIDEVILGPPAASERGVGPAGGVFRRAGRKTGDDQLHMSGKLTVGNPE